MDCPVAYDIEKKNQIVKMIYQGILILFSLQISHEIANPLDCFCPEEPMVFNENELEGRITTPINPVTKSYCPNMKCSWRIKAGKEGMSFRISFDWIDIESGNAGLELKYHGTDKEHNVTQTLAKLEGETEAQYIPEYTFQDAGIVELVFWSGFDVGNGGQGFQAAFERYPVAESNCTCPSIIHDITSVSTELSFTSPNYPSPHCHSTQCFYLLLSEGPDYDFDKKE